jgi:hypothetical protein
VGHAEVTCRERPPLQRETRLLESNSGSLDDAPDGALGDAIRLRATKGGRMKHPSQFAGRSPKFRVAVRIKTLDRNVARKRKKGFFRMLGRIGELGETVQPARTTVVHYDRETLAVPAEIVSRHRKVIGSDLVAKVIGRRAERIGPPP